MEKEEKTNENETYGLRPVLTAEEVASFLRMDRKSVYSAIADGCFPARKVGRRVVVLRDALLGWLRSKECVSSSNKWRK